VTRHSAIAMSLYLFELSIHIKSKSVKLEEISEVIILILERLSSIAKSEAENKGLEKLLENNIIDNGNERINQLTSLLVKVCTSYQGKPNEFDEKTALEDIMTLVLENPNVHLCQLLGKMLFVRYLESLLK
jgi:hypothetical protein